jgi:hypothetical protein
MNVRQRVYTDANVYDVKILAQAMDDISIITDFFFKNAIPLPEDADLVIDIPDDTQTNYYFANHETRSIFFLDTYETNDISIDSPGRLRRFFLELNDVLSTLIFVFLGRSSC